MAESPLANNWQGLRADVAPHLLDASESPETYDAAIYGDRIGVLGPRRGRRIVTAKATNVLGLGGLNVPWGRYRITATDGAGTDNATWSGATATWPSPTAAVQTGWDVITFSGLTATQGTIPGTMNGTAATFSVAGLSLNSYGLLVVKLTATSSVVGSASGGTGVIGSGKLQMNIGGSWTDIATITTAAGLQAIFVHASPAVSGSATQLRAVATMTDTGGGGGPTLTTMLTGSVYLMYGTAGTSYPAA